MELVLHELTRLFNCLTEEELCVLYDIKASTAVAWRKRGKGPDYVLAGNRCLYPLESITADLERRKRELVRGPRARDLL